MRATRNKPTSKKIVIKHGSGNVFADLGLPHPEERLAKSLLAHSIVSLISSMGLTQVQAARRMGIDQPKFSALLNGRLRGFSTERLMSFLTALDRDVVITITPAKRPGRAAVRVSAIA